VTATGALITILVIAAIIAFIALIKATVVISYSDEVCLHVRVLCFKIKILPSREKKQKRSMSVKQAEKIKAKLRKKAEKKKLSAVEKQKKKEEKKKTKEKKSISAIISDVQLFASLGVLVIQKFFKHLRIKIAKIHLIIATPDAATTAVAYGAVTQSLNILLPALESVKNFKDIEKADIFVDADFLEETPTVDIKLAFSIRIWHVFDIAFSALGRFIKKKLLTDTAEEKKSPSHKRQKKAKNKKKTKKKKK